MIPGRDSTKTTKRARELRQNATDAERKLWSRLRSGQVEGFSFRRQEPMGIYIVDFVCYRAKLVVEVDGSQHDEIEARRDARRDAWLESQGFRVLRFWNPDVLQQTDGVVEAIRLAVLAATAPHPDPPPQGGRGR
jgi:very-short-patch-repair endonuclease